MSLEVIGAGFGRTGTMSLKVALEELGYGPCYHMVELFEHPEHVQRWEAAVRGEPVDWGEMFAGYRATVDWPGAAFYAHHHGALNPYRLEKRVDEGGGVGRRVIEGS